MSFTNTGVRNETPTKDITSRFPESHAIKHYLKGTPKMLEIRELSFIISLQQINVITLNMNAESDSYKPKFNMGIRDMYMGWNKTSKVSSKLDDGMYWYKMY